jgi:thymidylate kinase
MKIIIEGADGSGKSTLVRYLSATTGYPVVHRSKPKNEEDRLNMMAEYKKAAESGSNEIWDRSFYSEMVYGKVMRDKSYISSVDMIELEQILSKKGAMVIFATGDANDLWHNCKSRGETYIESVEQIWELDNEFNKLFFSKLHLLPITIYNIKYGSVPTL